MIKVLFVVSTLRKTGPINMVYTLVNELDKSKFLPIILTLSREGNTKTSMIFDFKKINIPVYSLNLTRLQGIFKGKAMLKKFIIANNINIVHTHGLRPDLLTKQKNNVPIISSIHSNLYDDYTLLYGIKLGRLLAFLHIRSLKAKTPVACSNFVAEKLLARYGLKLNVIYNGVSIESFTKPTQSQKKLIREKLNLNLSDSIFISAASFISRKSPETIVNAFLLTPPLPNSTLLMLGDGPLLEKCKKMALHNPRIIFLGNLPNVNDYFTASDFYVSASLSEGLPIAVMEAMASGLPVILSDIKPHHEILNFIPNWPYMFSIKSSKHLAILMRDIIKDNYLSLNTAVSTVILENLNSKIMAKAFEKLYKQSINGFI